jgi:hypothetical protein
MRFRVNSLGHSGTPAICFQDDRRDLAARPRVRDKLIDYRALALKQQLTD